jgi:DNA polymerase-3 subunit gamma/tau
MLSTGAFNALLKTLEEPPEYVVFILATTEPHKLPATILSRCQRYDFRRITGDGIAARLNKIALSGGITVEPEALNLIARLSEGAMRDAISLLDQCISSGSTNVTRQDVLSIVGMVNESTVSETVDAIKNADISALLSMIDSLVRDGKDILKFLSDLIIHYRNLMICSISGDTTEFPDVPAEALKDLKKQSKNFSKDELIYIIRELSSLEPDLKWSSHQRILLETALIKLSEGIISSDSSNIIERLAALEKKLENDYMPKQVSVDADIQSIKVEQPVQENKNKALKPEPSQAKPSDSAKSVQKKLLEKWPVILNEIKTSGRMALYSYLLTAEAVELDDHRVGLLFNKGADACKMMVSKIENLEYLEMTCSKILGHETAVRCITEDEQQDSPKNTAEKKEISDTEEKARKLADLFKVDLNIIDD